MSIERSIASRYATALFELYQEGIDLSADLSKVAQVAENEDAIELLVNTQVTAENRTAAVMKAAGVNSEYVARLLTLLCTRNKAALISHINEILAEKIIESKSQVMVNVTVANELDSGLTDKLKDVISKGVGKKVDLNVVTDASIMGGLILNIVDSQIDHSVRGRLNGLKRALSV